MDLIQRAAQKREWHLAQAARLEAFLATAYDLEQDLTDPAPSALAPVVPVKDIKVGSSVSRRGSSSRPTHGVGADTINAAEEIVRERGALSTRDMLPLILAKGIEVGGKSPIATLSARLSNRSDLEIHHGKWQFKQVSETSVSRQEEAADTPTKETSAASLFTTNQGEQHDAAALTS